MDYTFLPQPAVATDLHNRFQAQLRQSYQSLLQQLHEHDPALYPVHLVDAYANLPARELNVFFSFTYHHSIQILESGRFEEVARLLTLLVGDRYGQLPRFVRADSVDQGLLTEILGAVILGTTYQDIRLFPMERATESAGFAQIEAGRLRLQAACPVLVAEIDALVHSVILFRSAGPTNERALSFTGNRFQSGILINGQLDPSWIFLLDKLVHESAHSYVFAINLQEELVLNTEGAVYASPLRKDLRTMNAIYHATFVIQRLIYAFSEMLEKAQLTPAERSQIERLVDHYGERVDAGYEVVLKKGRLSPLARRLLDEGQEVAKVRALAHHD